MKAVRSATVAAWLALSLAGAAGAQPAPAASPAAASAPAPSFHVRPADDGWHARLPRDADAATQAYLERLPADAVARSNAYFEGGYWLQLWNFLLGLGVTWLILRGGLSARVRDACARIGRVAVARDALYGAFFALASWVLALPLTVYQGWYRERQYGMATQTFGPWFAEQLIELGVSVVMFALGTAIFYAVMRRARERWWIWGTAVTMAMLVLLIVVAPVVIDPLFNTYKPVSDPAVRSAVLAMARADDVPVTDVYEFDASRQTTRVSANVSGLLGTAAVRLNDNLLRTSLPEIRAVMGHELGHYVLNHAVKSLCELALLALAGFMFAKWAMDALLHRLGAAWALQGVADVAGLPLLLAVFSAFMLVTTPISNTIVRTQEIEADRFGLNLAREPNGFAEAALKLTEYRKPDPGPIEEFVFFDHPATRHRIHDAMQWREAMGTP
ncbi:MAG: M48 family metallopeptidase [Vitreoscilla sp.]